MTSRQHQEYILHYASSKTSLASMHLKITDCYSSNLNRIIAMLTSMINIVMNPTYQYSTILRILPQCCLISIHANNILLSSLAPSPLSHTYTILIHFINFCEPYLISLTFLILSFFISCLPHPTSLFNPFLLYL